MDISAGFAELAALAEKKKSTFDSELHVIRYSLRQQTPCYDLLGEPFCDIRYPREGMHESNLSYAVCWACHDSLTEHYCGLWLPIPDNLIINAAKRIMHVQTAPLSLLMLIAYPAVFQLHASNWGDSGADGSMVLPPTVPASSQYLEQHGAYLVDCGHICFLWVGQLVTPELVQVR